MHHCRGADNGTIDIGSDTQKSPSPQAPMPSEILIWQSVVVESWGERMMRWKEIIGP